MLENCVENSTMQWKTICKCCCCFYCFCFRCCRQIEALLAHLRDATASSGHLQWPWGSCKTQTAKTTSFVPIRWLRLLLNHSPLLPLLLFSPSPSPRSFNKLLPQAGSQTTLNCHHRVSSQCYQLESQNIHDSNSWLQFAFDILIPIDRRIDDTPGYCIVKQVKVSSMDRLQLTLILWLALARTVGKSKS